MDLDSGDLSRLREAKADAALDDDRVKQLTFDFLRGNLCEEDFLLFMRAIMMGIEEDCREELLKDFEREEEAHLIAEIESTKNEDDVA